MLRIGLIVWLCLGALGLGLVVLEAARRKQDVSGWWYMLAVLLGPVFLFLILPLWIGRWGRGGKGDGGKSNGANVSPRF